MIAAVADTHSLIWLATEQRRLGQRVRRFFADAAERKALVYVSTLVVVELAEASHFGRLTLGTSFGAWIDGLFANPCFQPLDFTMSVARRAHSLFAIPERTDRLLAATALEMDCALITSDLEIAASGLVEVLW